VVALNQRDPMARVAARSDKAGHVTLKLTQPGPWLIKAVHMVPAPAGSDSQWASFWASLTFELGDIEAGRLFEQEVFAGLGRSYRLRRVQVVRRRDRDDVDVGRGEDLIVAGGDPRTGERDAVAGEVGAGAVGVARAQPGDLAVRVAQKRGNVLRRAPANPANGNAKFSIGSGHFVAM